MVRRAQIMSTVRVALLMSAVLVMAACSSTRQTVGGWFGEESPAETAPATGTQTREVYYSNVDGLPVYSSPSASSKAVGKLSLHEKVTRSNVERGYAYVESSASSVKGWVNNASLIWRLPAAPTSAAPAPASAETAQPAKSKEPVQVEGPPPERAAEDQAPAATVAPATEAPAQSKPAASPSSTPESKPSGASPSVLDAY